MNRIIEVCHENHVPEPEWTSAQGLVTVTFKRVNPLVAPKLNNEGQSVHVESVNVEQKSDNAQTKSDNAGVSQQRKSSKWTEVLSFCAEPRSRYEILVHIGLKVHTDNFNQYVKPLIDSGQLTLLYPDKPTSPKQKYVVPSGKHI